MNMKSSDAPSPSTQELLRQQELQLRVLQEQVSASTMHDNVVFGINFVTDCCVQVNSLLRSQSANSSPSPLSQGQSPIPKAEAGTNTGQSLFWHTATPTTTPTSSQPSSSTTTTATGTTEAGSQYDDENSVCSSAMADLNVSMQTATSILSQGVSEMHIDLQSYSKKDKFIFVQI